jgi:hypothetical protein
MLNMVKVAEENAMAWWSASRKAVPKPLRRGFDSLFMLIGWMLWKERNARTFDREGCSARELLCKIEDEAKFWVLAGNRHLALLEQRRLTLVAT